MSDEPYQITERGDPRDRIANQREAPVTLPADHAATVREDKILVALIPHKGHAGIPAAPEGVLCLRCNAERAFAALVMEAERATELERALVSVSERATELEGQRDHQSERANANWATAQRVEARATELERDLDEYRAANRYGIAALMREKQAAEARATELERENATLLRNIQNEAVQTIQAKEFGSEQFARAEQLERQVLDMVEGRDYEAWAQRAEQLERDLARERVHETKGELVARIEQLERERDEQFSGRVQANRRARAAETRAEQLEAIRADLGTLLIERAQRVVQLETALREILRHTGGGEDGTTCVARKEQPHGSCRPVIFAVARAALDGGTAT